MGIALGRFSRHIHLFQESCHAAAQVCLIPLQVVIAQRLSDDVFDGHARIQRGIGILKNHLHVFAQVFELMFINVADIPPFKDNRARCRFL